MIDAYVGLGSNMGDRLANISAALREIAALPQTSLVAVSHVYESEPWGVEDQAPFANAVAHVQSRLTADQLLNLLKEIEEALGREPAERYGPRVIDLDLLLYGDEEWDSAELTLPHPRMAERDFVITPLLEVATEGAFWPDGDPVTDSDVRVGRVTGELGVAPGFEDATVYRDRRRQGPPPGAEPDMGPEDFLGLPVTADYRVPGKPQTFRRRTGEEWVPLGVTQSDPSPEMPELLFYESVLNDEGIPNEFYPNRPNAGFYGPYWVPQLIDLYVPADRLGEARDLIRRVRGARPIGPGETGSEEGSGDGGES